MDKISFTRDEHANRSNRQINWTKMQLLEDLEPIANIYDVGDHYDVDYIGTNKIERIYKRNGYPKAGGYLEWYDADGVLKNRMYRGPGSNILIDGYGTIEGADLEGDSDAVFGSDGLIEGRSSFFGDDDFTEGYDSSDIIRVESNGNHIQQAPQQVPRKVVPFVYYQYTRHALSIFSKIIGTVNRDYPKGKAENITSLKDISRNLSDLKDRVKPEPKDRTLNASRYDEYLDLDYTNVTVGMDSVLNDMMKVPADLRAEEISNFENLKDKKWSNLSIINSWLNCLVNKIYLEHCIKNDEPLPVERISIPEHFINEIYISETYEELMGKIDKVLNTYVDEDGRVYHNSYAKHLKKIRGMVDLAQRDNKEFEKLLPRHDGSFKYNIIYPESKFKLRRETMEEMNQKDNAVNLNIVQDLIKDIIPDKYMDKLEEEDKTIVPDFEEMKLVDYMVPVIEEITQLNPKINEISSDFIFENMKGIAVNQDIINRDSSNAEKVLSWAYQNVLNNESFKRYVDYNPLLPGIFELLFNNISEDYNKEVMYKMITKSPNDYVTKEEYETVNNNLRIIMAERLKNIYQSHPDMAYILLALMNGDL